MEDVSILLINDNNEKVKLIKTAFELIGVDYVHLVSNYEKAFAVLKQRAFRVIFVELDIQDAQGGALEFIFRIRNDVENFAHIHDIPIIITAGAVTKKQVEMARDSGVTEFVIYPFSVSYISTVLKSVFKVPRELIVTKTYLGPDRRRKKVFFSGEDRRGRGGGEGDGDTNNNEDKT